MGDNMESMLLNNMDSSSEGSDDEEEVTMATGQVPGGSAVAAAVPPKPVNISQSMVAPDKMKQSELSSRLKSLYNQKSQPGGVLPTTAAQPAAAPRPPPQQQQQQQPPSATLQQRNPAAMAAPPAQVPPQPMQPPQTGGARPLMPNRPSQRASRGTSADPFEPTPLSKMLERQQNKQQQPSSVSVASASSDGSGMPRPQPLGKAPSGSSSVHSAGSASTTPSALGTAQTSLTAEQHAQVRKQAKDRKDKFLMFTRVLMKYLEQKNPELEAKAKAMIKDCADRNKRKEPGFESITLSMEGRLKDLVGPHYWNRAKQYLEGLLKQKKKLDQGQDRDTSSLPGGSSRPMQQSHSAEAIEQQKKAAEAKAVAALQARRKEEERRKQQQQAAASAKLAQQQQQHQHHLSLERIKRENEAKMAALRKQVDAGSTTSDKKKTTTGTVAAPPPVKRTTTAGDSAREHSELMEMVEHAVTYDWTNAGLLLGREARAEINLTEEQRKLLYGSTVRPKISPSTTDDGLPLQLRGWGDRNVVTPRIAWAKVRLREQKRELVEAQSGDSKKPLPVVGGLKLPTKATETSEEAPKTSPQTTWLNEDKAEEDKTLAVLSEATQVYLKTVMDKAVVAARQRQNLDGIRLWHQQHGSQRNPLALRLGCDMKRQIAHASGNAALTYKRMEEALERQEGIPENMRDLQDTDVLYQASSMADLAVRPKLGKVIDQARNDAKRSFDVYGGKDTNNTPPLGRVPKQPKILVRDFSMGLELTGYSQQRRGVIGSSLL